MAKYITTDINGKDDMEVEVVDNRIVKVVSLAVSRSDESAPSPEAMMKAVSLYMQTPDSSVVTALGSFLPPYASLKKVSD